MENYYRCLHCKSFLPKENYDYFLHVCFESIDHEKQSLFINPQKCCIYLGNKKDHLENDEINNSQLDQFVENPDSKQSAKRGRKTNEWDDYDELLIDAVRSRSCLWNYSLKERSTQRLNQAWNDVLKELNHSEFGLTAVKERWRNLRDSYQKARNKILAHTASEATYNIEPSFRFYNQMLFLSDYPHTHRIPTEKGISDIDTKSIKRDKKNINWDCYDELLIEAVKSKQCLWNYAVPLRKRGSHNIRKAWESVVKELNNSEIDTKTVQNRWRNLRDSYQKSKNKMIELASTGATSDIESSFRFYNQMLFLSDHGENIIVNNSSISNESTSSPYLSLDFTLNGDSNSNLDATNESTNEKSPIEIKKRKQECNMELHRELLDILKQQVISQPKELDEIGAFAKLVEECLRKLPYRNQKQLQRTIFDAMSKAEDECFEE